MKLYALTLAAALPLVISISSIHAQPMPGMDMGGPAHAAQPEAFAFGTPGQADKSTRTISVDIQDTRFAPAQLTVTQGETIRFVISNPSPIDHEFTIGDAATQVEHRREMAQMATDGTAMGSAGDANMVLVKAGKTAELIWTFTRPGQLEYDCNLPGHFESGMTGRLTVLRR